MHRYPALAARRVQAAGRGLRRAVALGVCKVNVNAELRERYLTRLTDRLRAALEGWRLLELESSVVDAVAEVVASKLDLIEGARS